MRRTRLTPVQWRMLDHIAASTFGRASLTRREWLTVRSLGARGLVEMRNGNYALTSEGLHARQRA